MQFALGVCGRPGLRTMPGFPAPEGISQSGNSAGFAAGGRKPGWADYFSFARLVRGCQSRITAVSRASVSAGLAVKA